MKRIILVVSLISALILMSATSVFAAEQDTVVTEYFPDGSYVEVTVENQSPTSLLRAAASTKSGSKTATYKNSAGDSLWSVKVSGTFSYNGSTSSCTSSSVTATSYSSYWSIVSKSASKSGNKATAKATANQYSALNTVTATATYTVSLTCSASGTLS
jgi:hypothetical protein